MALSDTCFDALEELKDGLVNYSDWNYSAVELSRVINAMYELGTFMARQDSPPRAPQNNLDERIDRLVVASILDKAHEEKSEKMVAILANIAKVNPRLSKSIDDMIANLSSKERLLEVIKDPRLLNELMEIQAIKNV